MLEIPRANAKEGESSLLACASTSLALSDAGSCADSSAISLALFNRNPELCFFEGCVTALTAIQS